MNLLKKLKAVLPKSFKKKLFVIIIFVIIGAFIEMLGVSVILPFMNMVMDPASVNSGGFITFLYDLFGFSDITLFYLVVTGTLILFYIFKMVYLTILYKVQYRFIYDGYTDFTKATFAQYLKKPYSYYLNHNTANLIRNINIEANKVFNGVVVGIMALITEITIVITLLIYLLILEPLITLIIFAVLGACLFITMRIIKNLSTKYGKQYQKNNGLMIKWTAQAFGVIKEMKIIHCEDFFVEKYGNTAYNYSSARRKQMLLSQIPRLVIEFLGMSVILILIIVLLLSDYGTTQLFGTLTAFAVATIRLLPSINRINSSYNAVVFNKSAIDELYEDIFKNAQSPAREKKDETSVDHSITFNNSIELKDISFKYEGTNQYIFKELSLTIKKASAIAIIGTTGSGKTTLVDILMGILPPTDGDILCDGKSILKTKEQWAKNIGYIPQTINLIDDTIACNIALGLRNDEIDKTHLENVLKKAHLHEFVSGLEEGYETVIGERGVRLSGGQRQRIGIARALYHNPKVLVMDEGTSSLDEKTEKEIVNSIETLHGEITMIVIAHRISTIMGCDQIYKLDDGILNVIDKDELRSKQ